MIRKIQSILGDLKLGAKLTILLLLVFVGGAIASGLTLSHLLNAGAQNEISSKALMLMETMNSVRTYTSVEVKPELVDRLETEFLPETIPAYSAREVFEDLRKNDAYGEFFYKEATLNPTNLRDKADAFETDVVQKFIDDPNLKELTDYRDIAGTKLFYVARPMKITKESCLDCHSTPDIAPPSLIERYGDTNGFGWQMNEIIGAQMITVPATTVLQNVERSFMLQVGVFLLIFAATILTVNFWLKQFVVKPLRGITKVAEAVSMGDTDIEFQRQSKDEVGSLAEAFSRMKMSLLLAMQRLDQYRSGRRSARYSVDQTTSMDRSNSMYRSSMDPNGMDQNNSMYRSNMDPNGMDQNNSMYRSNMDPNGMDQNNSMYRSNMDPNGMDRGSMDRGSMDRGNSMYRSNMDPNGMDRGNSMDQGSSMDRGNSMYRSGNVDRGSMDRGSMDQGNVDRGSMDQ